MKLPYSRKNGIVFGSALNRGSQRFSDLRKFITKTSLFMLQIEKYATKPLQG